MDISYKARINMYSTHLNMELFVCPQAYIKRNHRICGKREITPVHGKCEDEFNVLKIIIQQDSSHVHSSSPSEIKQQGH